MTDSKAVIDLLAKRFIARPDVIAVQHSGGAYSPSKEPFSRQVLQDHLDGKRTVGHYLLSKESECKLFAYDLDLNKVGTVRDMMGAETEYKPREVWHDKENELADELTGQLRYLAEGLAFRTKRLLDCPVAVAASGKKGLHVYAFTGLVPAAEAQSAAWEILKSFDSAFELKKGKHFWKHTFAYPDVTIECFPKQTEIADGSYGNLMKLPLGGGGAQAMRSMFLDLTADDFDLVELDPVVAMTEGCV